jgi:hypothetical protein
MGWIALVVGLLVVGAALIYILGLPTRAMRQAIRDQEAVDHEMLRRNTPIHPPLSDQQVHDLIMKARP